MWFPIELWKIIKNYQLGQKYWKRRMDIVLNNIPKPINFSYKIHTSATKKIRFTKEIQTAPFFKNPREVMMIYSILIQQIDLYIQFMILLI